MATLPSKRTPDQRDFLDLTITTEADGLSDVGDLGGLRLAGVVMSTGWTAADLAFQAGLSSATMYPLYRLGSSSTAAVRLQFGATASQVYGFDQEAFDGVRFIQLQSLLAGGSTGAAQAASRVVQLLLATPGPIK